MSQVKPKTAPLSTPYFEVKKSSIQGSGAFAAKDIEAGDRLTEYTGELISNEEADRRYDESEMERHHTFLFTLDDDWVIDGAVGGNSSIYINHSCEPNCEAVIDNNRIYIEALRNISEGEEILYDYQYEREDDPKLLEFYKCLCGAPTCRGTIMKAAKPKRKAGKKKAAKKKAAKLAKKKSAKVAKEKTAKAAKKKSAVKVASKSFKKAVKAGKKTAKKAAKKSAKKAAKKVVKKAVKEVAKKATKKAARKAVTKVAKKATKKVARKGAKVAKKATRKVAKKVSKSGRKKTTRR